MAVTALQLREVFRAGRSIGGDLAGVTPSAYTVLDSHLPGGGWPRGAVTELQLRQHGIGEIRLIAPALACVEGVIAFVDPPADPCLAALSRFAIDSDRLLVVRPTSPQDRQWAAEQLLGVAGAVLLWESAPTQDRPIRRLQVAAAHGRSLCFVLAPPGAHPIAAPLRLGLTPEAGRLRVNILKRRGASGAVLHLDIDRDLDSASLPAARP
ncbi:translesion DNA synthesis-associated protein ImuA [Rhodanobacter sp. B2A1Ga4]|uniref:translesion DNA synthesis-associated protein ImuA n=1 Tax=Rhodanobacter sp. B2A1Ga4 TaxID=2778647 RepID=UPI001B3778E7|nr:translesion DNA synthesis-associated protein ImuA [Rhodanobacter sp. B2A1Ga4]MBQ4855751.1 translesion DNA synthesis-associated protein ImuA [Rhodanobacter sp. B2A1Ga4]